jgi:hypothetical protein
MIYEVSDCGKTDLSAVSHKEDMSIDKENIYTSSDLLLEL